MKLKKGLSLLICALLLSGSASGYAKAFPETGAQCAIVYDALTGETLFGKNERLRRGMASTTKIMTALVALEQYDLEEMVEVKSEWCGIEGSSMGLKPGETLSVSDLLYGLLLESGNDAAAALAGLDPEGQAGFTAKMNARAGALSLEDTHFCNPSGLDEPEHYSTALDLARLTAFAMENEAFARMVSTRSITLAGRELTNHNRLLWEANACGVKTGYTMSSGRCLVSAKREQGRLLICVTLNDRQDWADHQALYAYAFEQYQTVFLVGAGDCGSVKVYSGEKSNCRLYCSESFSFALRQEEQNRLRMTLTGARFCYSPVYAGEQYGSLQVFLDEQLLWEAPVYFSENIHSVQRKSFLRRLYDFICR